MIVLDASAWIEVLARRLGPEVVSDHTMSVPPRVFDQDDVRGAWSLRESLSFADAWYAALARRLDAPWVTADHWAGRTALGLDVPAILV